LNTPAIAAFQILELLAEAEHHLSREVRFVARSVPANLTGAHEDSFARGEFSGANTFCGSVLPRQKAFSQQGFRSPDEVAVNHLLAKTTRLGHINRALIWMLPPTIGPQSGS
jgi:hypothetical protein